MAAQSWLRYSDKHNISLLALADNRKKTVHCYNYENRRIVMQHTKMKIKCTTDVMPKK